MSSLIITKDKDSALQRVKYIVKKYGNIKELESIDTLEKMLSKLPVIGKEELINYTKNEEERILNDAVLFSETSGTTGEPLQTPRGGIDLKWNTLNQMNGYKKHLMPGLDRIAILHPSVLSPFVEASCLALNELGVGYVRVFPIEGVCDYKRILSVVERYKITTLMTTPSLAYKLLYEFKNGLKRSKIPFINKVLLTGENISVFNAENMQSILKEGSLVKPFVYGASETATLMHGLDSFGYSPITSDFCFEIGGINRYKEKKIEGGDYIGTGKLIVTWLRDGMLPILRYDTGDIFSVYSNGDENGYVLYSEGRELDDEEETIFRASIDEEIYKIPRPIYHYEYKKNDIENKLVLITDDNKAVEESIINHCSDIEMFKNIDVVVNESDCSFYKFSPSPKMKKFIS